MKNGKKTNDQNILTMYRIIPQNIPQHRRAEINEKILFSLASSRPLPPETVYNCYTGDGGLHGLNQSDYSSYHAYSQAKKEIENGQFFTPHAVCRDLVAMLDIRHDESVIEMCCGSGNFINWLPNHSAVTAFDVDAKAVTVAKYLYPDAVITRDDLCRFEPSQRYDIAIGNPPFNLNLSGEQSQMLWITKSAQCLTPGGILMAIVPASFLADEFQDKSAIEKVSNLLSFIGQSQLPPDAFNACGVNSFQTKVMVFRRNCESLEDVPLSPYETMPMDMLSERIRQYRELQRGKKLDLMRESRILDEKENDYFEYKVKKYLYEMKAHRNLQKHLDSSTALVNRYRNQRPPQNATDEQYKEWERTRLHAASVLAILKRHVREQDRKTRKEVALVKTSYGFKLKAYAPRLLDKTKVRYVSINDILTSSAELPHSYDEITAPQNQYDSAMGYIRRRKKRYESQCIPLELHTASEEHIRYTENATFINAEGKVCRFTQLQKKDLTTILGRDHCLLNWQQGSGKTAAAFHRAMHLMSDGKVKNTLIVAPAIAVRMTWEPFLKRNGASHVTIGKGKELQSVPEGTLVVIPTTMLGRYKKGIKRFVKTRNRKLCLIFDESDELTNPSSQRTRLTLSLFRRLRYKVLATGTTTRNNIAELYSQIELLYNNSAAMTCWSPKVYFEDSEGDLTSSSNDGYGRPFPPRGGYRLFRACHCPAKASVFGIEKTNQNVYNAEQLKEIIDRTILTRKFRDFAGDRYAVKCHPVMPTEAEKSVYHKVITEFHEICRLYFADTGNARKESGLRLARQIRLLIKACSTPNMMEGYNSDKLPTKVSRITSIVESCTGKTAIGCTSLDAVWMYSDHLKKMFPERTIHTVTGEMEFAKRTETTGIFNRSDNDILVCTQQSLSSSVNIPDCNDVIIESLQWNIPRMEQFYFRFIRLDSENSKRVHFITYQYSIEQKLMALVLTKERLNDFIRTGKILEEDNINKEFGINEMMLRSFLGKEKDDDGNIFLTWGHQKICG